MAVAADTVAGAGTAVMGAARGGCDGGPAAGMLLLASGTYVTTLEDQRSIIVSTPALGQGMARRRAMHAREILWQNVESTIRNSNSDNKMSPPMCILKILNDAVSLSEYSTHSEKIPYFFA